VANVRALGGTIPGAQIGVIPDATHGLTFENPVAFNAAVLDFLRAH
jgi:pimeloyl-ACP methyl ester carboxylesterase